MQHHLHMYCVFETASQTSACPEPCVIAVFADDVEIFAAGCEHVYSIRAFDMEWNGQKSIDLRLVRD